MKLLYTLCFLFLGFIADCQKMLTGIVVNEANQQAVSKAQIFFNGTSIGTTTNEQGEFSIKVPFGRHILVASSPAFETFGQFINSDEMKDSLVIQLKTKSQQPGKTRDGYEREGWEKWGNFFLDNFIGLANNQCKIKNTKVLRFQFSTETGDLFASADEPLIIENKILGYTLLYKLETFVCNFKTRAIGYNGYFFFQPMIGNTSQQQNWDKRRSEVYLGSLMHFMRSVYRNKLEEEGFDVRSLKKIRSIPAKTTEADSNDSHFTKITDSIKIVNDMEDQIMNPDNYKDVIGMQLPGDSIAYAVGNTRAGLDFPDFLLVIYRGATEGEQNDGNMTSQLALINKRPIEIEADGSFYNYRDLIALGYWTWSEKIFRLLPFDYSPQSAK